MSTKFLRSFGRRRYRRLFLLSVEGAVTEPQYFDLFENEVLQVECLSARGGSSPAQVLERIKKRIDHVGLRTGDEVWLVVDKDRWQNSQLSELHEWAQAEGPHTTIKRGLAVSNPKFEFWLLLHFEDGRGVVDGQTCSGALGRYIPGYNKSIPANVLTEERIRDAVRRAAVLDTPPCRDWPRSTGTTVYRLVESLLR